MIVRNAYLRKGRGGRWRGVAEHERPDGTVAQTTRTFDTTSRARAGAMLAEWVAGLAADGPEAPQGRADAARDGKGETACGYAGRMVRGLAESRAIEPSTARDYTTTLKRLARALGDAPLASMTPGRVRECEAALSASGLSASSVIKAHRLLRQACALAVLEGLLPSNPCDAVRPPKRRSERPGINCAGPEARARLMSALDAAAPCRVAVAARVALWTGLREGEVCGLRWGDVDAAAGLLWVRRAVGTGPGGAYLKGPKSGRGRDVALPPALADALAAWRAHQGEPPGTAYVLTGTGRFLNPQTLCKEWRALADLLGLTGTEGRRVTFHDLRHTWATVAVAAGVDIKTVASNLGHADAAMTLNVYASADPDAKRRAAEIVQRAMRG